VGLFCFRISFGLGVAMECLSFLEIRAAPV
jgi:hypothetical protein